MSEEQKVEQENTGVETFMSPEAAVAAARTAITAERTTLREACAISGGVGIGITEASISEREGELDAMLVAMDRGNYSPAHEYVVHKMLFTVGSLSKLTGPQRASPIGRMLEGQVTQLAKVVRGLEMAST